MFCRVMFSLSFLVCCWWPEGIGGERWGWERREGWMVGGEGWRCCADGTFMMSTVAGAWSCRRRDKGWEKRESAGPQEGYAPESAPGGFGGLSGARQRQQESIWLCAGVFIVPLYCPLVSRHAEWENEFHIIFLASEAPGELSFFVSACQKNAREWFAAVSAGSGPGVKHWRTKHVQKSQNKWPPHTFK